MKIRKLNSIEERLQARRIAGLAFVIPLDMEKEEQRFSLLSPDSEEKNVESWGAFLDDGTLTAGLCNHHYTVSFDGHRVLCGGVGDVSSLPENRRQGAVRGIFSAKLREMREGDFLFSYLYPFSHVYYRQFGYELCQQPLRQWIKCQDLLSLPCTHAIEMQNGAGCFEEITPLSHRFMLRYNLGVLRESNQWNFVSGDPVKDRKLRYLFRDQQGRLAGYVCFIPQEENEVRRAEIRDIAYEDTPALLSILAFFGRLSAQYQEVGGALPPDVDLRLFAGEPYAVRQERTCAGMGRIVHVEKVLSLMKAPQEVGEAVIEVEDPFLPANSGRYRLLFENGAIQSVSRTELPPDLSCRIGDLTRLVLGTDDPLVSLTAPGVTVAGKKELLCRLFPKKNLYMNQPF